MDGEWLLSLLFDYTWAKNLVLFRCKDFVLLFLGLKIYLIDPIIILFLELYSFFFVILMEYGYYCNALLRTCLSVERLQVWLCKLCYNIKLNYWSLIYNWVWVWLKRLLSNKCLDGCVIIWNLIFVNELLKNMIFHIWILENSCVGWVIQWNLNFILSINCSPIWFCKYVYWAIWSDILCKFRTLHFLILCSYSCCLCFHFICSFHAYFSMWDLWKGRTPTPKRNWTKFEMNEQVKSYIRVAFCLK